jgi:hypothetical protein
MIKRYFKTDIIEAVQYTGDNYKEIAEFVSPRECLKRDNMIINIYNYNKNLSMSIIKGDYITKSCNGLRVFNEERLKEYKAYDKSIGGYSKIGSIGIGKDGVCISLDWNVLDRHYDGNIDLYIKGENK